MSTAATVIAVAAVAVVGFVGYQVFKGASYGGGMGPTTNPNHANQSKPSGYAGTAYDWIKTGGAAFNLGMDIYNAFSGDGGNSFNPNTINKDF